MKYQNDQETVFTIIQYIKNITMLEHQIIVLRGVSHDKYLFRKELLKSLSWLNAEDQSNLFRWVCENYLSHHPEILKEVINQAKKLDS